MNKPVDITLRAAQKGELAGVYRLEQRVFGEHCYPDFFFRQSFDCWPSGLRVAIDHNNRLLGYILMVPSELRHIGWILSVAVETLAQGRGIGKRFIIDALNHLAPSVTQVMLTVDPANPARHLYLALGFVELQTEADYFGPDASRVVMCLMR